MKASLLTIALGTAALSFALVGCKPQVSTDPGHSHDGVTGQDPNEQDTCGSPPDPTTQTAIAIRWADIPPIDGSGTSGSTGSGGADGPSPDSVLLVIGNAVQSCASPFGPDTGCVEDQQLFITLSPEQVANGTVIDLATSNMSYSEMHSDCSGGGGGGFFTGTLVIDSVDDYMVNGHFAALAGLGITGFDPNFTFSAGRCEAMNGG